MIAVKLKRRITNFGAQTRPLRLVNDRLAITLAAPSNRLRAHPTLWPLQNPSWRVGDSRLPSRSNQGRLSPMMQDADTVERSRRNATNTRRVQIVMDRFGDTRHEFDVKDAEAVARAEERFRQLTGAGFRAAALSSDGSPGKLIRKFDKEVEKTLFVPQLQGG
jgi:hypothetical protein